MFSKRTTIIVVVLSFLITGAVLGSQLFQSSHNRTLAQDQGGLSLKSGSALAGVISKGSPLRFIASGVAVPVAGEPPLAVLNPTSVTTVEILDTPVVLSVTVPRDSRRTNLLLVFNSLNAWLRVASTSPYTFFGRNRITFTSDALPSPFTITASELDGQSESLASTQDIGYSENPSTSFALDEKLTARLLRNEFTDLTEEQAIELARELIKCEIKMDVSLRVTLRSVSVFFLGNMSLQVFGDGIR